MSNKLHISTLGLTIFLSLSGIPKIADSSEPRQIASTHIAQANIEEIAPESTEDSRGSSWYWLLLLLIPLGLGGLLLARRPHSEIGEKESGSSYSNLDSAPVPTSAKVATPLHSEREATNTVTNRVEDETILATEFNTYNRQAANNGDRRREELGEAKDANLITNNADKNSMPVLEEHPDDISKLLTENRSDRNDTDISTQTEDTEELEAFFTSDEISLEEITFDEETTTSASINDREDDEITGWLESLDSESDDVSEWLSSLDDTETERVTRHHSVRETSNFDDGDSSLYSIDEATPITDDDSFKELQDLLDEDDDRNKN